jgi:predicted nucleic acid-binding protein
MLLRLGETGAIELLISPQVLAELQAALARKVPESLPLAAVLLDRSTATVVTPPDQAHLELAGALIAHPGDAVIVAAAWQASSDFLVTLDRQHFLENLRLNAGVPFVIGTPGDALAQIQAQLQRRARGAE